MGELLQFGIGRNLNDPAILPRVISCLTLSYATIGYCKTDFFSVSNCNLGPVQFILNPDVNPFLVVLQYLYVDIFLKQYIIHLN